MVYLLILACGGGADDTGVTSSGPPCVETRTPLSWDETSSLGWSGQEVLDQVAHRTSAELLDLDSGGSTGVTIFVEGTGDEVTHVSVGEPEPGQPDWICGLEHLEVPLRVTVDSDDGRLGEAFRDTLTVAALDDSHWVAGRWELDELEGAWEVQDDEEWVRIRANLGRTEDQTPYSKGYVEAGVGDSDIDSWHVLEWDSRE